MSTSTLHLDAFTRALAGLTTAELRDLLHDTRGGEPIYVHAIDVELLHREQADELATFRARLADATDEQIQHEARRWCCRPGNLAAHHRHVIDEEQEWRLANQHTTAGARTPEGGADHG
jgi:hypothetical protein